MARQDRAVYIASSPLGEDELRFVRMSVTEQLGRIYQCELELTSADPDIEFEKVLGQPMSIALDMGDGKNRFFHGHITEFSFAGFDGDDATYSATLRPWLWYLTRTSDCRIFQQKSTPDIITEVFKELGFSDFENKLADKGAFKTWDYCVQYRETDFNFISRLMEDEGIYYYFKHEESKHTLVLSDSSGAHEKLKDNGEIPFRPPTDHAVVMNAISDWQVSKRIQPATYMHTDYDFTAPKKDLKASAANVQSHSNTGDTYEIYDFPGEYLDTGEGDRLARIRMEELHANYFRADGHTNVKEMTTGALFTLAEYPRKDQNQEYLVVSASYQLVADDYRSGGGGGDDIYQCSFTVMPSAETYRSPRLTPKPMVQGLQTAIVVGPSGEEIHVDEYGRVKVQFHWDRYGKADENSSCWVRVSTNIAGRNWGGIHIPRIGQEVIVEFLEGDPDRPVITGSVWNADHMPPYELPGNKTQSGFKSRSSKSGTADNFNELRFEDKKGSEQVYLHAELNMDRVVENDETHSVGNDRTVDIGNNETVSIGNDQSISVGNDRTDSVAKNESISIGENRDESVGKNETISIGENRTESVGGDESISITGDQSEDVGKNLVFNVGDDRTTSVGKDDSLSVGKKYLIDVADELTIKVGSAKLTMKKDGTITLNGKDITLKASGKINAKASGDVTIKGSKVKAN